MVMNVFPPHGAILGLDGIFDGRDVLKEVSVETIKNPKSLGRDDKEVNRSIRRNYQEGN